MLFLHVLMVSYATVFTVAYIGLRVHRPVCVQPYDPDDHALRACTYDVPIQSFSDIQFTNVQSPDCNERIHVQQLFSPSLATLINSPTSAKVCHHAALSSKRVGGALFLQYDADNLSIHTDL